ncbi:LysR family transcriptional regulator [Skermanella stibiiresistens SB22]|uniref:LysR family transcriptional regulator n=1 Tax=Skermanella stibiiresistens SB22 TaxID=1385369 RepID=W9GUK8_9PROT|nr:LysR family transcriptional regulator [Skermanella stibiiresistens]EWY36351.1 LysR family transcriptional regulator [Skermanella stibiiresistens SB22]
MDRITTIAAFVRTVELGSQAAASEDLGLSRAMIGRHIQQLEDRLGVRLLNRTTRKQSLTEAGLSFFEKCASILEQLSEAERVASELQAEPRGTLRVNGPMSFGNTQLASALAAYCEKHPRVRIELVLNDRQVDLVEEGYDVAVRIARLTDSSLIARRIAPVRLALCAAPAYLRRHGIPKVPADLARHNCLLYSYAAPPLDWTLIDRAGVETTVRVGGTLSANNGDALVAAAVGGLGIVRQPTFIIGDALRDGRLVEILTEYSLAPTSAYAVYPHARNLSPKVRSFVDFLVEHFRGTPPWDIGLDSVVERQPDTGSASR